jgi:hypothetical protein
VALYFSYLLWRRKSCLLYARQLLGFNGVPVRPIIDDHTMYMLTLILFEALATRAYLSLDLHGIARCDGSTQLHAARRTPTALLDGVAACDVNNIQPSHDTSPTHSTAQGCGFLQTQNSPSHHAMLVAQTHCHRYIAKHLLTFQTSKLTKLYLSIEAPNIAQRPFLTTADLLG